jgi:hypothetical protein
MTIPNWRDALKELETEMKEHPQQEAPLPKPEADSVPETESKPEHRTRAGKAVKAEPVAKAKPAVKTSSPKAKTAAKKSK